MDDTTYLTKCLHTEIHGKVQKVTWKHITVEPLKKGKGLAFYRVLSRHQRCISIWDLGN